MELYRAKFSGVSLRQRIAQIMREKEVRRDDREKWMLLLFKKWPFLEHTVNIAWPTLSAMKLIRAIVFLGCMCGFLVQMSMFLKYYLQYPTVVDVQVTRPDIMELPAITFCRRNSEPTSLEMTSNNLNLTQIQKNDVPVATNPWDNFLLSCETYSQGKTENCRLSDISVMSVTDQAGHIVDCYTLFSKMNSSIIPSINIPQRKKMLLQMAVSLTPDLNGTGQTIQIAMHSPYTLVNPYRDGFVLDPAHLYIFQILMQEKLLLESPYDTDCTDYRKLWKLQGGKGPLSHQMCIELCILDFTRQKYNCTFSDILYPHDKDKLCSDDELNEENFSFCRDSCKEACKFTTYEYELQKRQLDVEILHHILKKDTIFHQLNRVAVLQFYLKRPEILTFTHRPQFQFVETFSYIGGLLGIWLGISLIAILDCIEGLTKIGIRLKDKIRPKKLHQAENEPNSIPD